MADAQEYGKALFLLAEEQKTTKEVSEDLLTVRTVLTQNPEYTRLADTPALSKEEKLRLFDEAFASVNGAVRDFLKILCERHSVWMFPKCADVFSALYDESRGIVRATVVTAVPMGAAQKAALTAKLSAMTGKTVLLTSEVDPSLLGGARLRCGGVQTDGSLRTRLDNLERKLTQTVL